MPQPFQRPSTQVKSWQCQKQSIIACFRDVGNRPCATDIIDMSHKIMSHRTNARIRNTTTGPSVHCQAWICDVIINTGLSMSEKH